MKYECPIHGIISENEIIHSKLDGLECDLCLHCYIEQLINSGVSKVVKINEQDQ